MTMIHPTIETLRRLRLFGMAKALEEQQNLPDCDRLTCDERPAMLVDREAVERDNAALAQRLRLAACALGNRAARDGFAVRYQRLTRLLDELALARVDGRATRLLAQLARIRLLI